MRRRGHQRLPRHARPLRARRPLLRAVAQRRRAPAGQGDAPRDSPGLRGQADPSVPLVKGSGARHRRRTARGRHGRPRGAVQAERPARVGVHRAEPGGAELRPRPPRERGGHRHPAAGSELLPLTFAREQHAWDWTCSARHLSLAATGLRGDVAADRRVAGDPEPPRTVGRLAEPDARAGADARSTGGPGTSDARGGRGRCRRGRCPAPGTAGRARARGRGRWSGHAARGRLDAVDHLAGAQQDRARLALRAAETLQQWCMP